MYLFTRRLIGDVSCRTRLLCRTRRDVFFPFSLARYVVTLVVVNFRYVRPIECRKNHSDRKSLNPMIQIPRGWDIWQTRLNCTNSVVSFKFAFNQNAIWSRNNCAVRSYHICSCFLVRTRPRCWSFRYYMILSERDLALILYVHRGISMLTKHKLLSI